MRLEMYIGVEDFNVKRMRDVTIDDILKTEKFISDINVYEFPSHNEIDKINIMAYMYLPLSKYEDVQKEDEYFLETYHSYLCHLSDLYQITLLTKFASIRTTLHLDMIYQDLYNCTKDEFNYFYRLLKGVK